jgi:predicted acetyltransferase
MIELRRPGEDDRDQVAQLLRVSMNLERGFVEHRAPRMKLDHFLCAYEGTRMVATTAARPYTQWFGGRELPMTGVYAVTTRPETRGTGIAARALTQLLHEERERGALISALYPAAVRPYRSIGFELAGTMTEHTIALDDLPSERGSLAVEEYGPADFLAVRGCYERVASTHNGPIDSDSDDWWPLRILQHWNPDDIFRVVVARGEHDAEGYASFAYEKEEGDLDVEFRLACKHFVATTPDARRSLFAYLRGFRGLGRSLVVTGPPADPLTLAVEEQRLKPTWAFRWMLRLLDVPGALEARGYPPVSGEAVIAVDDPLFADNHGPWRIEADAGKVRVTPAEAAGPRPIPIGALSSLFTGYVSAWDTARLGYLDADDPAVPFLALLLAGPAPFMYEFF